MKLYLNNKKLWVKIAYKDLKHYQIKAKNRIRELLLACKYAKKECKLIFKNRMGFILYKFTLSYISCKVLMLKIKHLVKILAQHATVLLC